MTATLTEQELVLLRRIADIQEEEIVSFCIDLDIYPVEPFIVDDVVERILEELEKIARTEGLPISKYDAEDLNGFATRELGAFATALGVKILPNAGKPQIISAIVQKMKKVSRKLPRNSKLPLYLTYFLPALIRHFSDPS